MKKLVVRKTQAVKLTSAMTPLYGGTCGIGGGGGATHPVLV